MRYSKLPSLGKKLGACDVVDNKVRNLARSNCATVHDDSKPSTINDIEIVNDMNSVKYAYQRKYHARKDLI